MGLRVTGLSQAIRFNRSLTKDKAMLNMIEQIVKDTVALMRQYAPVDTGELMEAIRYEKVDKSTFKIIIDVPWAIPMEFGTQYFPKEGNGTVENPLARTSTSGKSCFFPFARPAVFVIQSEFPEYINRVMLKLKVAGS